MIVDKSSAAQPDEVPGALDAEFAMGTYSKKLKKKGKKLVEQPVFTEE